MRTIRNIFAVMLMGLAFTALQADAQSRSRTSSSQDRPTSQSRTSVQSRTSSSSNRQTVTRQSSSSQVRSSSSSRQTVARSSSSQSRPSGTVQSRPSSTVNGRPSENVSRRPSGTVQHNPSVNQRPSAGVSNNRPQSGAVGDRKPSTTVRQPGDRNPVSARPQTGSPGYNHGDKKPQQHHGVAPQRPSTRPNPGQTYKPDHHKPPVKVHHGPAHAKPRIHPVHRDFIAYDRAVHFWKPSYHYFGHRVRLLPARARMFRHHGITYYCYNDIWYRPHGSYYVICRPPFGTILASHIIADIAWTAVRFSYYNTVANSYRQLNENNSYIAEQNEIIARNNATIAAQNQTIAMNAALASATSQKADRLGLVQSYANAGSEYFYQDGVFYSKSADGEYQVIVPPAGALVEALPEDYETVTLDGEEYYKVDGTVYKLSITDGKPFFEVMGQMI